MDVTLIATAVTSLLGPLLPYLVKGGEKAAEEAASKLVGGTWELAKKLWSKLSSPLESRPAAREALEDVAKAPDQEDPQAALRLQIKKLLEQDAELKQEISRLLEEGKAAGVNIAAFGERSVAAQNIMGSTVITGDIEKGREPC